MSSYDVGWALYHFTPKRIMRGCRHSAVPDDPVLGLATTSKVFMIHAR